MKAEAYAVHIPYESVLAVDGNGRVYTNAYIKEFGIEVRAREGIVCLPIIR